MNINTELAKELMLAGFPAKIADATNHDDDVFAFPSKGSYYLYPSLSELIEACGNGFELIQRRIKEDHSTKGWVAYGINTSSRLAYNGTVVYPDIHGEGSTPEEAVARLWLVLNPFIPRENCEAISKENE